MIKRLIIKKIAAAGLLIVFAFSITPIIVFHNWLAGHTDTLTKCTTTNGDEVSNQTFNCHCDHIVAESPFTDPATTINDPFEQVYSLVKFDKEQSLNCTESIFHSLRGPPVV